MKDKVKRRRIVSSRKIKNILNDQNYTSQSHQQYELEREKILLEEKQQAIDKIVSLQLKLKVVKEKSKQLNYDFLKNKRNEYPSSKEFYVAYKEVKQKRKVVINGIKNELKEAKQNYIQNYETFGFKIRRWFFGMGKEFNRVTWLDKKSVFTNLIIVVSISVFLAIIFLIIDIIFSLF
ncbi:MAG: preprotein translocase subunit SecE [Ureaplasma sp.]|nr:preprotein translocase subunit SecE [Ureaplasma sp.]MDE7222079.1 preprotein translocase subunit SecE [Ureaplasma sp.]